MLISIELSTVLVISQGQAFLISYIEMVNFLMKEVLLFYVFLFICTLTQCLDVNDVIYAVNAGKFKISRTLKSSLLLCHIDIDQLLKQSEKRQNATLASFWYACSVRST